MIAGLVVLLLRIIQNAVTLPSLLLIGSEFSSIFITSERFAAIHHGPLRPFAPSLDFSLG